MYIMAHMRPAMGTHTNWCECITSAMCASHAVNRAMWTHAFSCECICREWLTTVTLHVNPSRTSRMSVIDSSMNSHVAHCDCELHVGSHVTLNQEVISWMCRCVYVTFHVFNMHSCCMYWCYCDVLHGCNGSHQSWMCWRADSQPSSPPDIIN